MAEKKVTTKTTKPKLPSEVFAVDFNESLVHQALTSYMSNERQGSVMLKNRSAVRGGVKNLSGKKEPVEQEQVQFEVHYGLAAESLLHM